MKLTTKTTWLQLLDDISNILLKMSLALVYRAIFLAPCIAFSQNGKFAPTELLTREELASVVVLNSNFAFRLPAEFDVTESTAYAALDFFER